MGLFSSSLLHFHHFTPVVTKSINSSTSTFLYCSHFSNSLIRRKSLQSLCTSTTRCVPLPVFLPSRLHYQLLLPQHTRASTTVLPNQMDTPREFNPTSSLFSRPPITWLELLASPVLVFTPPLYASPLLCDFASNLTSS